MTLIAGILLLLVVVLVLVLETKTTDRGRGRERGGGRRGGEYVRHISWVVVSSCGQFELAAPRTNALRYLTNRP
ncbi:MAG: hypothetical protein DME22_00940 [Verrucomicrobia bacterium]|nr:MAG: hypothetical protein DME22_00940 [Verrucomicrobiota bacterium]PYJ99434.1 MAG: hypothetical protein DME23_09590 [Verrucomicrobiota bacterium]